MNTEKFKIEIKKEYLIVFVATLLFGLLAHGFSFLNKISFFDDIGNLHLTDSIATVMQGRWFWGLLLFINERLFGEYSIPWLSGMVSMIVIGFANILIASILNLKKTISLVLLSAVIPVSIGTLVLYAYMYCAVYYSIAILLSILSTYIYMHSKFKSPAKYVITVFLQFLSISIAQNYFLFGAIVFFYYMAMETFNDRFDMKKLIGYTVVLMSSALFYSLFVKGIIAIINGLNNTFELGLKELSLSSYQGMDRIGTISLFSFKNIQNVFKHILAADDILFGNNIYIYYIIIFAIFAFCFYAYIKSDLNLKKLVVLLLLFVSIILLCNCMYILQPPTFIYALTIHQKCLIFLAPVVFYELIDSKILPSMLCCLLTLYYGLYGIAISNRVNLWRYFRQCNEIRWCQTLVDMIQSSDGFDDDYDIYLYGDGSGWNVKKSDKNFVSEPWPLKNNNIYPFRSDTIQYYTWIYYVRIWCGFDISKFHYNEPVDANFSVADMPCYPDDGSIQVVNGRVIVKLSE